MTNPEYQQIAYWAEGFVSEEDLKTIHAFNPGKPVKRRRHLRVVEN